MCKSYTILRINKRHSAMASTRTPKKLGNITCMRTNNSVTRTASSSLYDESNFGEGVRSLRAVLHIGSAHAFSMVAGGTHWEEKPEVAG